jgi:D-ribose pyranose/furanose isomerase RbsD
LKRDKDLELKVHKDQLRQHYDNLLDKIKKNLSLENAYLEKHIREKRDELSKQLKNKFNQEKL